MLANEQDRERRKAAEEAGLNVQVPGAADHVANTLAKIHGPVRHIDYPLVVAGIQREGGIADGRSQAYRVVAFSVKGVLFNGAANPFRDNSSSLGTGFSQKSGKLVTAITE